MMYSLLDEAKDTDMYLPILILLTVGLRRGELLALRWEDIDFKKNILKVRRNMVQCVDIFVILCYKYFS